MTASGIEPEVLDYRSMRVVSPGYQLRPEIIESAYYLFHYTKDPRYLEMGRTFFEAIQAHCRTDSGYTNLKSVVTKEKGDLMPSYFLAETLKYFYLLFVPDAPLDFDHVVFNTEAHPLRRVPSSRLLRLPVHDEHKEIGKPPPRTLLRDRIVGSEDQRASMFWTRNSSLARPASSDVTRRSSSA